MFVDVIDIDQQMAFLHGEISRLREQFPAASWAAIKAEQLGRVFETLRKLRQAKQMAGVEDVTVR